MRGYVSSLGLHLGKETRLKSSNETTPSISGYLENAREWTTGTLLVEFPVYLSGGLIEHTDFWSQLIQNIAGKF